MAKATKIVLGIDVVYRIHPYSMVRIGVLEAMRPNGKVLVRDYGDSRAYEFAAVGIRRVEGEEALRYKNHVIALAKQGRTPCLPDACDRGEDGYIIPPQSPAFDVPHEPDRYTRA